MQCQSCNEHLPLSATRCFNCGAATARDAHPRSARAGGSPRRLGRVQSATPLRDRPYASARQITTLTVGQAVTLLGQQWGFDQVETVDGRRGFVEPAAISSDADAEDVRFRLTSPKNEPWPRPPSRASWAADVSAEPAATPPVLAPQDLPGASPSLAVSSDGDGDGDGDGETHTPPAAANMPHPPAPSPSPVETTAQAMALEAVVPSISQGGSAADGEAPLPRRTRRTPANHGGRRAAGGARSEARHDDPPRVPGADASLPFNIPTLDGERVRYRAVFLYNPNEDQSLVVTNRRLILTGGAFGSLPKVLHLDEIEAVRLRDSGTGSTNGEGNIYISVTGVPGALHIGAVHMPHIVRGEILAACTERQLEERGGGRQPGDGRRAG